MKSTHSLPPDQIIVTPFHDCVTNRNLVFACALISTTIAIDTRRLSAVRF
jgi:hypothetical protein